MICVTILSKSIIPSFDLLMRFFIFYHNEYGECFEQLQPSCEYTRIIAIPFTDFSIYLQHQSTIPQSIKASKGYFKFLPPVKYAFTDPTKMPA